MAIDPNIILQGQQQQQNPINGALQTFNGLVGLNGNLLQQKAQAQQIQANNAASDAFKQATDPLTGKVDYDKLTGLLSTGPAAYNIPQIQGQIAEQRNKQLDANTKQYDLAYKQQQGLRQGMGSLLIKPDLSPDDVVQFAVNAVQNGLITPQQAQTEVASIPQDPTKLKPWLTQHYLSALQGEAQLKALTPSGTIVNTGGKTLALNTNPFAVGGAGLQGEYQNTMSPDTASTPTQIGTTAGGQPIMGTRDQFVNGTQPQAPTQRDGRYPKPASPGGVVIGLPAGAGAAADVAGTESAKSANGLATQAEGSPQRVYFLQDMAHQLENFNPGPGADWTNKAKSLATQLAPGVAAKLGIDPSSIASKEEFTKFSTQLALQQAGQLGGGTDSKLATALTGNPNSSLSKLGNQQIIQTMIGLERATQLKNQAWQQSGVAPQDYQKWSAQWNAATDPRVFVADQMTDAQLQKMYKGMTPAEQKKFNTSWAAAEQAGLLGH